MLESGSPFKTKVYRMSIHIVSHVYASELPQYSVFLRAQLSSLVINKPVARTRITVCFSSNDSLVVGILEEFKILLDGQLDDLE
mgnify:CR=1 FL=1